MPCPIPSSPIVRNRTSLRTLPLLRLLRQARSQQVAYAKVLREDGVRFATERDAARARAELYAGPRLTPLLERARASVQAGHLSTDDVSQLESIVPDLDEQQQRREVLLRDALDDYRYHLCQLEKTGRDSTAFWYALRDVSSRRMELLRTVEQATLVRAELESLLARALVSRARTLPSTRKEQS